MSVGEVDLLIALPSFNNATTISACMQAIEESYQQYFVRDRVLILNVDGGSTDNTRDAIATSDGQKGGVRRGITSLRTVHRVTWQYAKTPSAGMALRTVLATADLLRARACAVVSPAVGRLDPSLIVNLLKPAYRQDMDFVAPLYSRDRYQGLLARNLLYPMSRAVFGHRFRELYSDDWAFSGRLAAECLNQDVWKAEAVRARPEAWMGLSAVCAGLKTCQAFLGTRPLVTGSGLDIVEAIRQTVGNLFWCLENFESYWVQRTGSQPVMSFGPDHELTSDGKPANPEKIHEMFRSGVSDLDSVLPSILTPETWREIKALAALEPDKFRFGYELWVRTLYEFAASYHRSVINRDHIVQTLVPLYRGRIYSFLLEHAEGSPEEMEADLESLCLEFERQKPYLIERWKAKS